MKILFIQPRLSETAQNIDFDEEYDLVGITDFTPYLNRTYEIAEEFKKRNVKVVLGSYHPSALLEESRKYADSVVIEAEDARSILLKDLEKNRLKTFCKQKNSEKFYYDSIGRGSCKR
jgi:hypothetical protein